MVGYESLRLSQTSDGSIALVNKQAELPSRGVESITGVGDDELEPLSAIIEMLNATYGANLTDEDRLFIGTLLDTLHADKNLETVFKVNPPENVKTVFADRLTKSMIEKVNTHKAFADRFFNDDHFQKDVIALMMDQVQKGFDLSDEKRILQMIAQGESTTMEFKSSLRYNRRKAKRRTKSSNTRSSRPCVPSSIHVLEDTCSLVWMMTETCSAPKTTDSRTTTSCSVIW